jgi:hypothetical protein
MQKISAHMASGLAHVYTLQITRKAEPISHYTTSNFNTLYSCVLSSAQWAKRDVIHQSKVVWTSLGLSVLLRLGLAALGRPRQQFRYSHTSTTVWMMTPVEKTGTQ